jgi:hypothetical protein
MIPSDCTFINGNDDVFLKNIPEARDDNNKTAIHTK